jgi:hypothetical protein
MHTLPTPADRLHLLLCQPPTKDWAANTHRDFFGIHVLRRTKEGWNGQDTKPISAPTRHDPRPTPASLNLAAGRT